jgi:hypothetical protein
MPSHTAEAPYVAPQHWRVTDITRRVLYYIYTYFISVIPFYHSVWRVIDITRRVLYYIYTCFISVYDSVNSDFQFLPVRTIACMLLCAVRRYGTLKSHLFYSWVITDFEDFIDFFITTFFVMCDEITLVTNVMLDPVVLHVVMYVFAIVMYIAACWRINQFAPRCYFIFSCFYMMLMTFLVLSSKEANESTRSSGIY